MVKCKDCAFLAATDPGGTDYKEVARDERERLTAIEAGMALDYKKSRFHCLVMAANLRKEYEGGGGGGESEPFHTHPTKVVVCADRECPKFADYAVGFSPKEMEERVRGSEIVRIAEGRRVDDAERAEAHRREDKAWQAEQREKDKILDARHAAEAATLQETLAAKQRELDARLATEAAQHSATLAAETAKQATRNTLITVLFPAVYGAVGFVFGLWWTDDGARSSRTAPQQNPPAQTTQQTGH